MQKNDNTAAFFATHLLEWYKHNAREHPWKFIKDPYKVWVSEIILQQTRVESGRAYYQKFLQRFPRVEDLALSDLDAVYQVWKGLGYYSRARNMHHTAKTIVSEFDGSFPADYDSLISLKGIGPYTAAAISSFAFDLSFPVVDGNVLRVMSRIFGVQSDVSEGKTKKEIDILAKRCLGDQKSSLYNQAILDFGATVCKPKGALCIQCPMKKHCFAYRNDMVTQIPLKKKKIKIKERFFHYMVIKDEQDLLVYKKREQKDIWTGLIDFPLIETSDINPLEHNVISGFMKKRIGDLAITNIKEVGPKIQRLTHQKIASIFYEINVVNLNKLNILGPYQITSLKKMNTFAVPKVIDWYLKDNSIYLLK